jgi:hypothetical protein
MNMLTQVADQLCQEDWEWSASWWETKAANLGLVQREVKGKRRTYHAPNGALWDIYLDEDSLLLVEIEIDSVAAQSLSDSEYEDAVDEYASKFEMAVKELAARLGKPAFCDGAAAGGFPEDQDAIWLALWPTQNARIMLQQKNEARELPLRLVMVVAPRGA